MSLTQRTFDDLRRELSLVVALGEKVQKGRVGGLLAGAGDLLGRLLGRGGHLADGEILLLLYLLESGR